MTIGFAYSSPVSFRRADQGALAAGEIFFATTPTAAQLAAAFPTFVPPTPITIPPVTGPITSLKTLLVQKGVVTPAEAALIITI